MRLWYFGCHRRALGHPSFFFFFFAVLFWIKIPLRVCLFSNTIAPKSRLLNCYTTVVLLLRLRCYENILQIEWLQISFALLDKTIFFNQDFFFSNCDSHIFSLANIYIFFFSLISAQELPLFVKNAGAGVLVWEMKQRLGMSEVFQMPRATNWPNRETLWQLCERADAEEWAWPRRCAVMLLEWTQTIELWHWTRRNTICHCEVVSRRGQFVTRNVFCVSH